MLNWRGILNTRWQPSSSLSFLRCRTLAAHSLLSHTPEQRPTAIAADCYYHLLQAIASFGMEREAAQTARESLDLAFHMSNILDTGLDRHTLSVLIALCDLGFNPEALSAVVRELRTETTSSSLIPTPSPPLP